MQGILRRHKPRLFGPVLIVAITWSGDCGKAHVICEIDGLSRLARRLYSTSRCLRLYQREDGLKSINSSYSSKLHCINGHQTNSESESESWSESSNHSETPVPSACPRKGKRRENNHSTTGLRYNGEPHDLPAGKGWAKGGSTWSTFCMRVWSHCGPVQTWTVDEC